MSSHRGIVDLMLPDHHPLTPADNPTERNPVIQAEVSKAGRELSLGLLESNNDFYSRTSC